MIIEIAEVGPLGETEVEETTPGKAKKGDVPHLLTVLLVFTTVAGTLAGALLGAKLGSEATLQAAVTAAASADQRSKDEFLRTQRQAAYSDFIEARTKVVDFEIKYQNMQLNNADTRGSVDQALVQAQGELVTQVARVNVIASDQAFADALNIVHQLEAMRSMLLTEDEKLRQITPSLWADEVAAFNETFGAELDKIGVLDGTFEASAKQDLGIR